MSWGGVKVDCRTATVTPGDTGKRLDILLPQLFPPLTRSQAQKLISEGNVQVNGQKVKASFRVAEGETISEVMPEPRELAVSAEAIPLNILYEDVDVIVINKPRGMVVHPAAGNYTGTLVNALLHHCHDFGGINNTLRPGIVHRLDKDTTGVLMVAKNDLAQAGLTAQIKQRTVKRLYLALVHGGIKENTGCIDAPIGRHPGDRKKMAVVEGGRRAVTHFRVLERFSHYTLIEARLETGRTHQIRVHFAYIGHPVAGDPVYGPKRDDLSLSGQALHAQVLGFNHPRTGAYLEFIAPLPDEMAGVVEQLRQTENRQ